MNLADRQYHKEDIVNKAITLGASLAGITSVPELRKSPSHIDDQLVSWPEWAQSVLVIAVVHPAEQPELDWWDGKKGTPGNRVLIDVAERLQEWLEQEWQIKAQNLMYHVENGGVYLKDAAVTAGLGVIGKNNLLITPEFGPRVRLRTLLLDVELEPTTTIEFDPCLNCEMPCIRACRRKAFENGFYERERCNLQIEEDREKKEVIEMSANGIEDSVRIKYCRACERACPIGK